MQKEQLTDEKQIEAGHRLQGAGHRRMLLVSGALLLLVIAGFVVAYLLGYVYAGVKTPAQRVAVGARVCGEELVNEFNTRTQNVSFPMSEADKSGFAALKKKITSVKHNEDDPTCQTMLFQMAYTDMNVPEMDAAYKNVQKSYQKGVYSDSNLLAGYHPNTMKSFMNDAKGAQ